MNVNFRRDYTSGQVQILRQAFGKHLQENVPMTRYSTARVGGPVEYLIEARSTSELVKVVNLCWKYKLQFIIIGGGSNILVSDTGIPDLVVLNRSRQVRFTVKSKPPKVWAESGANFGLIARQSALRGFSGLEWAVGIPGTLGGAVVGNAGAHGRDMASSLMTCEVFYRSSSDPNALPQMEIWPVEKLEYTYRSSVLKRYQGNAIILNAHLCLEQSTQERVKFKMDEFTENRLRTQPPGASMGSIFKNPPGDYAGRLIEATGLKGKRVGGAEISTLHANFILNLGQATASDIYTLINLARSEVFEKFGINLELEIQLIGNW
jgi:UDP-N-acetylmuramate dehydrogenase